MLQTVEVRWFQPGEPPADVIAWFGTTREEKVRTDYYLAPTDAALNVKLREGAVEVKRREAEEGEVRFAPHVTGRLEHWCKWRFLRGIEERGIPDAHWQAVRKARRTRTYALRDGHINSVDEPGDAPTCHVELTRIDVREETWWTLCLEASGPAARDVLQQTAVHIFTAGSPTLQAARSLGYPAWLLAHDVPTPS